MVDKPSLLTTGQAAQLCSVTPDTILKWIKKGRISSARTAGGHYRIRRGDLERLIVAPRPHKSRSLRSPPCSRRRLRCWEYLGQRGKARDNCRQCVVYRVRAARCFLMANLETDVGHARQFCGRSCEECVYYRRAKGLPSNVLVITSDDALIQSLVAEEHEGIALRFARNAYEASAIIEDFRPGFAVVDMESIPAGDAALLDYLAADSRVPGLKIAVLVSPGMTVSDNVESKHGVVVSVLEKPLKSRRITAVVDSFPVHFLAPEDIDV